MENTVDRLEGKWENWGLFEGWTLVQSMAEGMVFDDVLAFWMAAIDREIV